MKIYFVSAGLVLWWKVACFRLCFVLQYQNIFKALFRTLAATGKACFRNKFM
jgi:hypothetical protein